MDNYKIYPKQFKNAKIPIEKNRCFFIMPFSQDFDIIYGALKEGLCDKYICSRVDEIGGSTPIINKILVEILKAQFIIADLSFGNPNVFYELGIAHTFKDAQNIFLLKDKKSQVPFDITHLTYLEYDRSNLRYVIAQLRQSISENKYVSEFYESLNAHKIILFNHDNQEYAIELIRELCNPHLTTVTELLSYTCSMGEEEIAEVLLFIGTNLKKELQRLGNNDFCTVEQLTNFYFELLISSSQYCNVEPFLDEVLQSFFAGTSFSEKEAVSLQTDCAIKFAKNHQRLGIVMPWIVNYFKKSRFATVDLNRYKLESFLLTNQYDDVNQTICNALCDTDAHIREHFANIIGEKRLTQAKDLLVAQLLCEENYYSAASMIEALGRINAKDALNVISQWLLEHEKDILLTKSYFVLRHTLVAISRMDANIAQEFQAKYQDYLI